MNSSPIPTSNNIDIQKSRSILRKRICVKSSKYKIQDKYFHPWVNSLIDFKFNFTTSGQEWQLYLQQPFSQTNDSSTIQLFSVRDNVSTEKEFCFSLNLRNPWGLSKVISFFLNQRLTSGPEVLLYIQQPFFRKYLSSKFSPL